jgi:hypothetical protein
LIKDANKNKLKQNNNKVKRLEVRDSPCINPLSPQQWCQKNCLIVCVRHPVGNPKRKVWWAQQQVFPQYETEVYRASRRKNQLPKVDACWLGDNSR